MQNSLNEYKKIAIKIGTKDLFYDLIKDIKEKNISLVMDSLRKYMTGTYLENDEELRICLGITLKNPCSDHLDMDTCLVSHDNQHIIDKVTEFMNKLLLYIDTVHLVDSFHESYSFIIGDDGICDIYYVVKFV
jgi:hypothetical protein